MAVSNAQRQANYRRRSDRDGLVRLQSVIDKDVDDTINELATRLNATRYAVIEHAIERLAKERLGYRPN